MKNDLSPHPQNNAEKPEPPSRKGFNWRRWYRHARSAAGFISAIAAIVRLL